MEKLERRALTIVLVLIGAALLIALQLRLAVLPWRLIGDGAMLQPNGAGPILAAATLGLVFGLIGCPVCGVPLAACVSFQAEDRRYPLVVTALFNAGRLLTFLLIGMLAWFGLALARTFMGGLSATVAFCAVGVLMILLGINLFAAKEEKGCTTRTWPATRLPYVGYFLWGAGIGLACGMEALAFALPVWGSAASMGFGGAMLVLLVFCLAALLPITVLVLAASLSILALRRVLSPAVLTVARYAGGAFVMFFGTQFICMGLRGLIGS